MSVFIGSHESLTVDLILEQYFVLITALTHYGVLLDLGLISVFGL